MSPKNIAVIGGGAAGLYAAITAARAGAAVTLYEQGERVGRKLLATGNGRCNLTNKNAGIEHYHGGSPQFVLPALKEHSVEDTLENFAALGVVSIEADEGKCYPRSLQAAAVLDCLRLAAERFGVTIMTKTAITAIKGTDGNFTLFSAGGQYWAQRVIIACGGAAANQLGGSDSGYRLLEGLGHSRSAILPAIVQLKTDTALTKGLSGLKIDADVTLYQQNQPLARRFGEVLFTDYGLSGPPVLYLSTVATRLIHEAVPLSIGLDIVPEMQLEQLMELLQNRRRLLGEARLEDFGTGFLPKRLSQILLKASGAAPLSRLARSLDDSEITHFAQLLKDWRIAVKNTTGLGQAQVTAGGILTDDFNPQTMASKRVPGIYACGEVLDIDGDCGGYNLQWAWSSGYMAGRHAAEMA